MLWRIPPSLAAKSELAQTENAIETERDYDEVHFVGAFLDSEGNKL
jgi:hypothetical protein